MFVFVFQLKFASLTLTVKNKCLNFFDQFNFCMFVDKVSFKNNQDMMLWQRLFVWNYDSTWFITDFKDYKCFSFVFDCNIVAGFISQCFTSSLLFLFLNSHVLFFNIFNNSINVLNSLFSASSTIDIVKDWKYIDCYADNIKNCILIESMRRDNRMIIKRCAQFYEDRNYYYFEMKYNNEYARFLFLSSVLFLLTMNFQALQPKPPLISTWKKNHFNSKVDKSWVMIYADFSQILLW